LIKFRRPFDVRDGDRNVVQRIRDDGLWRLRGYSRAAGRKKRRESGHEFATRQALFRELCDEVLDCCGHVGASPEVMVVDVAGTRLTVVRSASALNVLPKLEIFLFCLDPEGVYKVTDGDDYDQLIPFHNG
jgi:hypothetical protein